MPKSTIDINITGIEDVIKAISKLENRVSDLEKKYKEASASSKKFSSGVSSASSASTKGAKSVKEHSSALESFNKRLGIAISKIISYRIAFGAFRSSTNTLNQVIDLTIEMDDIMGDLQKVLLRDAEAFEFLERRAFALGKQYGRTGAEIAKGFLVFAQQGLNAAEILDRTEAAILAVSSSTLKMEDAVESLTAVSKNFGDELTFITDAVDKWAKVAATAPVTAKDLADGMLITGAVAKQAGLSMDELNGVIAAVAEQTRKTGKNIGQSLKTIFARFARPEVIDQLKDIGVLALKDSNNFRKFGDVIRDLHKVWGDLSGAQQFSIALALSGIRRYNDFLALMQNFDRFTSTTTISMQSLGFAQRATEKETGKLSRQFQSVLTNVQELGVEVGGALVDDLLALVQALNKFVNVLKGTGPNIAATIKYLTILGTTYTALRISVALFNRLTIRSISVMTRAIRVYGAMTLATRALTASMSALKITLGGVFAIAGLLIIAWQTYSAVVSKSEKRQKDFENSLNETAKAIEEIELAAEGGKKAIERFTQDVDKIELVDQLNQAKVAFETIDRQIKQSEVNIQNLRKEIKKLDNKKRFSPSSSINDVLQANKQKSLKEEIGNLSKLREQLRLTEGKYTTLQAAVKKANGEDFDVLDLHAYKLAQIDVAADKARKTLAQLVQQSNTQEFKPIEFKGLDDLKVAGISKTFSGIEGGVIKTREQLEKAIKVTEGYIDKTELLKQAVLDLGKKSIQVDPTFKQRKNFSKAVQEAVKLNNRLDRINAALKTIGFESDILGRSFDPANERIDLLTKLLGDARKASFKFKDDFDRAVAAGKEIGIVFDKELLDKAIKADNFNLLLKDTNALKDQYIRIVKEAKKIIQTGREYYDSQRVIQDVINNITNALVKQSNILKKRAIVADSLKRTLDLEDAAIQQQQITFNYILNTMKSMSKVRQLDSKFLQKQRLLLEANALLEFRKSVNAAETSFNIKTANGKIKDQKALLEKNRLIDKARLKLNNDLIKARLENIRILANENIALRQNIASSLSTSLTDLPSLISDRVDAEKDIAQRRKQFEDELAKARAENDTDAINRAKNNLAELQVEAKNLGSILGNAVDIFGNIAKVRLTKIAESLTEQILSLNAGGTDVGTIISESILQANSDAAIRFSNRIIDTFESSSDIVNKDITDGFTFGKNKLDETFLFGANTLNSNIYRAILQGSVVLKDTLSGVIPNIDLASQIRNINNTIETLSQESINLNLDSSKAQDVLDKIKNYDVTITSSELETLISVLEKTKVNVDVVDLSNLINQLKNLKVDIDTRQLVDLKERLTGIKASVDSTNIDKFVSKYGDVKVITDVKNLTEVKRAVEYVQNLASNITIDANLTNVSDVIERVRTLELRADTSNLDTITNDLAVAIADLERLEIPAAQQLSEILQTLQGVSIVLNTDIAKEQIDQLKMYAGDVANNIANVPVDLSLPEKSLKDAHVKGIKKGMSKANFPQPDNKVFDLQTRRLNRAIRDGFRYGSTVLGQTIFGGGRNAAKGAQIGGFLGDILGLASKANPITALLYSAGSSLLGGFIGSQFDKDQNKLLENNTTALDKNTIAIENNNRLLELQREFINAPARFTAPAIRGQFGGGIDGGITVQVNVNGSNASPEDIKDAVVIGVDEALGNSIRISGNRTTFGR